jgi:hypothetical protein
VGDYAQKYRRRFWAGSKLLTEFGIEHRIFGRSIRLTHYERYILCFDLFINKRASLIKFYKYISFSLHRKQIRINQIIGVDNASGNIQHFDKEKRSFQSDKSAESGHVYLRAKQNLKKEGLGNPYTTMPT